MIVRKLSLIDSAPQPKGASPWQFLKTNTREGKPRAKGLTEIRGSYYSVVGTRYLEDVLESAGAWIDSLKFAGGAFTLLPEAVLRRFLEAGAYLVMIESEGITENVAHWRTKVAARFIDELGLERIMFETADPAEFEWYIRNYGHGINLFVDHRQILQLECLRQGIWGMEHSWGRIQGL